MIPEPANSESLPPKARVTLRKNSTGEVFVRDDDWTKWASGREITLHNVFWQWTEGNYNCDCNRHCEWLRSRGMTSEANRSEFPCGGNEYTLLAFEALP